MVPWFSLWGNLSLAIYKLVVGTLGGSSALIADALHSFADVVGSAGIVVATKVASRDPDSKYPYGLGKAEFIGAVFVYTLLLFFGAGIAVSAIRHMFRSDLAAPGVVTLLGAVVSVFYNYLMFRYATCVGKRNHSPAILADAFENRADAISSVACIGGILGAMFVHPICDPIAALFVGIVIFWNCQEQLRDAATSLLDKGLDPDDLERVHRIVLRRSGVRDIAFLRTRRTGARYWIDLGIELSGDLPVNRADAVAVSLREELMKNPTCHHVEVFIMPASEQAETAGDDEPEGALGGPTLEGAPA
jgi:cation diffusion facilitator family transporter